MRTTIQIFRSSLCLIFPLLAINLQGQSDLARSLSLYEKIYLDDEVMYLHKTTHNIISLEDYNQLYNIPDNQKSHQEEARVKFETAINPSPHSTHVHNVHTSVNTSQENQTNTTTTSPEDLIIANTEYRELLIDENNYNYTYNEPYWDTTRVNAYKQATTPDIFPLYFNESNYAAPVSHNMHVTSRFGHRKRGPHRGIDVDLVTGDKVMSILPGRVRFVGYSRGHGRTVVVRHANEVETVYAHLSKYNVKTNDLVSAGQVLGKGGATGNARGSHLHFELRYRGICIHPEYVMKFDGSNQIRGSELWVTSSLINPKNHSSYRKSDFVVLASAQEAQEYKEAAPKFHQIQSGDTLYGIALNYNLRLSEICKLNSIRPTEILKVGKTIKVR